MKITIEGSPNEPRTDLARAIYTLAHILGCKDKSLKYFDGGDWHSEIGFPVPINLAEVKVDIEIKPTL